MLVTGWSENILSREDSRRLKSLLPNTCVWSYFIVLLETYLAETIISFSFASMGLLFPIWPFQAILASRLS